MGPLSLFDKLIFRFLYFITHKGIAKYFITIFLINIFMIIAFGVGDGVRAGTFVITFLTLIVMNGIIARDLKTEFKRYTKYQILKKKREQKSRIQNGK